MRCQVDYNTSTCSLEVWGRDCLIIPGQCWKDALILSRCPPPPRIKALAVVECQSSFYILRMKADANANIPMKATMTYGMGLETPVTPHANSAIDIEIILGETSP